MAYYEYSNQPNRGFLSSAPKVTRTIIIINIFFYIATMINKNAMIENFALFYPTSHFFRFWQPLTHMFMHGGFFHVLINMYMLYMFGSVVENIIGTKKFLLFYFICGFGAAALHTGVEYLQLQSYMEGAALGNQMSLRQISLMKVTPTVGASGAIYGILIAYAMLFPQSRMTLLFPPITLSAKSMTLLFIGIELLTGLSGSGGNIAHFAHLGGALFGFLLIKYWRSRGTLFDKYRF